MANTDTYAVWQYMAVRLCRESIGAVFRISVQRPDCLLILANGNIFDLMAVASRTLKEQGQDGLAKQMVEQITNGGCNSYEDALNIIGEYVNITSVNNQAEEGMGINELEM